MGEDEITHATVGLVLNSLDDIHCLTEARHKDTDFLDNILDDDQLHALLNLYDQISTNSYRPFRWVNKIYYLEASRCELDILINKVACI